MAVEAQVRNYEYVCEGFEWCVFQYSVAITVSLYRDWNGVEHFDRISAKTIGASTLIDSVHYNSHSNALALHRYYDGRHHFNYTNTKEIRQIDQK